MTKVDWLLKLDPRAAQIEAIRRSYYGEALWDQNPEIHPDAVANPRILHDGPRRGWAHYLQMRLGKTPTFLNEFGLLRRDYSFKWAIILTPPKFKLDWPIEAERFGLDAPGHAYSSTHHDEAQTFIDKNRNVGGLIAINYETLRYAKNKAILESIIGDKTLFGCDESVNIKNPGSMYTEAALMLVKDAGAMRLLSGKPVVQSPFDYWAQLRFIGEQDGVNPYQFKYRYCKLGGFQGKQLVGSKNEEQLYAILDTCSWAPRRVDWMKTYGIDYVERQIQLPDDQIRMYREMQKDFMTILSDGTVVSADIIVGKLLKMQQISSGFLYDEFHKVQWLVPDKANVKANEIDAILREELPDNEKLIVFTYFTPSVELLRRVLAKYNPEGIWKGQTDQELVDAKHRFNNDPKCRVFIANAKGVKYGNTLMGTPTHPCTAAVFYENHYSLDDRAQCEERNQGAGQVGDLTVYDLICTAHDRAPVRALQRKEDVSALMMRYARNTGLLPPKPEIRAA